MRERSWEREREKRSGDNTRWRSIDGKGDTKANGCEQKFWQGYRSKPTKIASRHFLRSFDRPLSHRQRRMNCSEDEDDDEDEYEEVRILFSSIICLNSCFLFCFFILLFFCFNSFKLYERSKRKRKNRWETRTKRNKIKNKTKNETTKKEFLFY